MRTLMEHIILVFMRTLIDSLICVRVWIDVACKESTRVLFLKHVGLFLQLRSCKLVHLHASTCIHVHGAYAYMYVQGEYACKHT
jgi:hypothetical protein